MKNPLRSFVLAGAACLLLTASALAGQTSTLWQTFRKPEDFAKLKKGDKIVYVCNECKTVSEVTVASPEEAMEHCKEGATVTCPSCKMKVRVAFRGPPKNQSVERQVTYVNEKGEECMFIAKAAPQK
ncbi:hypothetical protein [Oleiharenicola sp. Vm1]|jgi:DNA-directed RNA polymerase subunit RPC12/RpoP|uniref:hypothetical protein n=1 Tax=Oleiharenicola sp. Vm1 TaxID=3398393 RepID=UPI0039F60DEF